MDIRWLRTFVTAAELENFRHASEKLYMAQPTVTVHIHHLEERLGARLFERAGRNIILSETGKQFLPYARRLLATHDDGLQQLVRWQQGYERKLTLAVSPLIAASRLPYWIRDYTKRHPKTEVIVQVAESSGISEMVEKNDADLGLSLMKSVQPSMSCERLYEDPMLCVAPHDGGDMESSPPLDFEVLLAEQLLFTHNHPVFWDDLLAELRRRSLSHRTMVVSQVHVTKRFIEEGLGFSFLPKSAVQRELLEGRMLEVDVRGFEIPDAPAYVIGGAQHEEAQKFRAFLREHFGG